MVTMSYQLNHHAVSCFLFRILCSVSSLLQALESGSLLKPQWFPEPLSHCGILSTIFWGGREESTFILIATDEKAGLPVVWLAIEEESSFLLAIFSEKRTCRSFLQDFLLFILSLEVIMVTHTITNSGNYTILCFFQH